MLDKNFSDISILSFNLLINMIKNKHPIFINGFWRLLYKKLSTSYPHKIITKSNSISLAFTYK